MINIKHAQTKQLTTNGLDGEWVASFNGEELYRLPAYVTAQDTFVIRDTIKSMMERAVEETEAENAIKMEDILKRGQHQLDALKQENERLAMALEQHILTEEAI